MKTNKFLSKLALVLLVSITIFSCKEEQIVDLKNDSAITSFALNLSSLDALADATIKAGVTVEIVGEEILINIPFGLKADTISKFLSANAATVVVSNGATVSPASGTPVKFNVKTPIYYTVTAEDGVSKTAYKVRFFETAQKGYGVVSEYWRKKGTQFTDKFTSNNEKTFAVTPTHIIQQIGGLYGGNLKLVKLSMLDGNEAGYAKLVVAPGDTIKQIRAMAGDRKGGFVGCNIAAPGQDFKVWAWDAHDATPRQLIKWNVDGLIPVGVAPSWAGNHVGRRISIVGDLKTEAYIYSYANFTLDILRWKITNGVATASPEKIHYTPGGSMSRFELWTSVIPMGATATSDIIVNSASAGSEVGVLNGSTKANYMSAGGVATPKGIGQFIEYNGIKYYIVLNVEAYATPHSVNARLYDYTTTNTSAIMGENWWLTPVPQKIEADGTLANGDATGCVDAILDADGQGFKVVALGTGCGIVVTKFSKKKEMTF
ncbi:MAG: DUF5018 domain-containing protein [Paludibacter sp.]|nr:DUF5018 domain-containing protein [Paludibacter sp.]